MKVRGEFGRQGDKGHEAEPVQIHRTAVGMGKFWGHLCRTCNAWLDLNLPQQDLILLACFSCLICTVSVVRSSSSPPF